MTREPVEMIPLLELLAGVKNGRVALPNFQRPYVWTDTQVKSLAATALKGWPCGSLLVMSGRPEKFKINQLKLDWASPLEADIELVLLDGQQRVTSLARLFQPNAECWVIDLSALVSSDRNRTGEVDEDQLEDAIKLLREKAGVRTASELLDAGLLALPALLGGPQFFELCRSSRKWGDYARSLHRRSAGGIPAYALPGSFLSADTDAAAVARIFERINRSGTALGTFDLMVARAYSPTWNLRRQWEQSVASRPALQDFFGDDGLPVLRLISMLESGNVRQSAIMDIPREVIEREWDRAIALSEKAIAILTRDFGVYTNRDLPSAVMFLAIAGMVERGVALGSMAEWYWHTAFGLRYEVASNTRFLRDIEEVKAGTFHGHDDWFTADRETLVESSKQRRSAVWRAFAGALRANDPHDARTGERIDPVNAEMVPLYPLPATETRTLDYVLVQSPPNGRAKPPFGSASEVTMKGRGPTTQLLPDHWKPNDRVAFTQSRIDVVERFLLERAGVRLNTS